MSDRFARSGASLILLICAALLAASASIQVLAVVPSPVSVETNTGEDAPANTVKVRHAGSRAIYPAPQAPVSSPSFGPQRTITCPSDAVDIWPGNSIQRIVNVYPGATTFCLRAGVHYLYDSITPKTGNVFVGEYGAILDGTRWITTEDTAAAFRAHNQDIDDVAIRNLVIRNMPGRGVHAYQWMSDRWTIEHNNIGPVGRYGVNAPHSSTIRYNIIHDSAIGGYAAYLSNYTLWEHNEFFNNGHESKISLSVGSVFRNNYVHHNRNGIWFDGENPQSLIENNLVEDNALSGIFYEVNGQGIIRNNLVRRNADHGILISLSHDVEIYGNTLDGNWRGIIYFVDCSQVGSPDGGYIGEEFYMRDVSAHDNTISVGTRSGSIASGFSYAGTCTTTQLAPYLDGSTNLTFSRNTYRVPSLDGWYWIWDATRSWNAWRSVGQDVDGVIAP